MEVAVFLLIFVNSLNFEPFDPNSDSSTIDSWYLFVMYDAVEFGQH